MLTTAPSRPAPDVENRRQALLPEVVVEARPAAPLRVVPDVDQRDVARRRIVRRLMTAVVLLAAVLVFGVVVAHVLLMQGQFELQELETRSTAAQNDFDRLRLEVSQLESPERIVATAQERLGMVAPESITYLAPSTDPAAQPVTDARPSNQRPGGTEQPVHWTTVKSHLAGR